MSMRPDDEDDGGRLPDDFMPVGGLPVGEGSLPRVGQRLIYTADQHRFFDDLVNVCISLASFTVAALTYQGSPGGFGLQRFS